MGSTATTRAPGRVPLSAVAAPMGSVPELPAGRARTAFLFASGYYRVHAPPQASRSVGTLRRLRDEPGSMVRFGFDLYREYARVIREAPASAP
mgnify:CR=1 FL=1